MAMRRVKLTAVLALLNVPLLAVVLWQGRLLHQKKEDSTSAHSSWKTNSTAFVPNTNSSSSLSPARLGAVSPGNAQMASNHFALGATNKPKLDWRHVESEDYRTYVKNLREIGCPEQTVRDIVTADLLQAFAARRAEVTVARFGDFKYWKTDPQEAAARQKLEQDRRALDDEMSGALRELLAAESIPPATAQQWRQAALDQQLNFLPADKREKTEAVLLQYADIDEQIRVLASGDRTPENTAERRHVLEAYDAKRAALQALLTPEEYEQLDLTVSWTADNLRRAMEKFEPTEEEFRAIFHAWRIHDERLARLYATDQPDPGNAHVFARIQQLLGEKRYEQYRSTWWK